MSCLKKGLSKTFFIHFCQEKLVTEQGKNNGTWKGFEAVTQADVFSEELIGKVLLMLCYGHDHWLPSIQKLRQTGGKNLFTFPWIKILSVLIKEKSLNVVDNVMYKAQQ